MLDLFIKSTVIFFALLLAVRLMGKRQLGELQPFEFVITLLIANVASVPIADRTVPVVDGVIPIITLYFGHCIVVWLALVSIRARRIINGKPLTLITPDGIDSDALKKAHMSINDLVSALRQQGYFTPDSVQYAILETNGKVSVMPVSGAEEPTELPYTVIAEGKIMERSIALLKMDKFIVFELLEPHDLGIADVLLLTVSPSGKVFIQPNKGRYIQGRSESLSRSHS